MNRRIVRSILATIAATSFGLAGVACASAGPDEPAPTPETAAHPALDTTNGATPETFSFPHAKPLCVPKSGGGWLCVDGGTIGFPNNQ